MGILGDVDPLANFDAVTRELIAYAPQLGQKPQLVVATKIDIPSAKLAWERFQFAIQARGWRATAISAVTGEGIGTLLDEMRNALIP
jgi:GTP-binding protein